MNIYQHLWCMYYSQSIGSVREEEKHEIHKYLASGIMLYKHKTNFLGHASCGDAL